MPIQLNWHHDQTHLHPYPCRRYHVDLAISITLLDIRMVEPKRTVWHPHIAPLRWDFLGRWLRGTPLAPIELMIWACGAFVILTWLERLFARFNKND